MISLQVKSDEVGVSFAETVMIDCLEDLMWLEVMVFVHDVGRDFP